MIMNDTLFLFRHPILRLKYTYKVQNGPEIVYFIPSKSCTDMSLMMPRNIAQFHERFAAKQDVIYQIVLKSAR